MNKVLATLSIGTLMVLAAPGVANAKGGGGVTVKGVCSASSSSKLKVKADNSRIETEFEVDQNHAGDTWKVTISDNGTVVAHAKKTVTAPSDSFTLHKRIANLAGPDMVVASATDTATGETCSASTTV